jgi:hypothetical protein
MTAAKMVEWLAAESVELRAVCWVDSRVVWLVVQMEDHSAY